MTISEDLQRRIQNLTGDTQMGMLGPYRDTSADVQAMRDLAQAQPQMGGEGQEIINQIEAQEGPLTDEEKQEVLQQIEAMSLQAQAPLAEQAMEIQHMGTEGDTLLAHLEPGDVIVPPDLIEDDPEFESYLEQKFNEYDINPESRVAQGIGSLEINGVRRNPITGLPEYGFFKKIGKKLKKIIRPVAKIAQFIPGPWQPVASMADKALTVYDVAKGKASPLALLSVAGPLRTGPSFGESWDAFNKGGGFRGAWQATGKVGEGGIADLFRGGGRGAFGGKNVFENIKNLGKSANPDDYIQATDPATGKLKWVNKITGEGLPFGAKTPSDLLSRSGSWIQGQTRGLQGNLFGTQGLTGGLTAAPGQTVDEIAASNRSAKVTRDRMRLAGQSDAEIMKEFQLLGYAPQNVAGGFEDAAGNFFTTQQMIDAGLADPTTGQLLQQVAGQFAPATSSLTSAASLLAPAATTTGAGGGFLSNLLGGGQGGGSGIGSLLGLAGAGALAGTLGKLAYEETKKMKGVPITPMTAMGPTGRFNIEAEVNRRMGLPPPDPVEFGLLPECTIPELSGGMSYQQRYDQLMSRNPATMSAEEEAERTRLENILAQLPDTRSMEERLKGGPSFPTGRYGGAVMAYANGGDVALADFERMNGNISGMGTETSDDIPAMLSDGEFVMTGQAVRGAGAYELAKDDGGILTLIPSLDEDRERGTDLMYSMMEEFGSHAHA